MELRLDIYNDNEWTSDVLKQHWNCFKFDQLKRIYKIHSTIPSKDKKLPMEWIYVMVYDLLIKPAFEALGYAKTCISLNENRCFIDKNIVIGFEFNIKEFEFDRFFDQDDKTHLLSLISKSITAISYNLCFDQDIDNTQLKGISFKLVKPVAI